jgi:uncharacterized protein
VAVEHADNTVAAVSEAGGTAFRGGAGEPTDEDVMGGMMPMVGDTWPAEMASHWMVALAVAATDATAARCEELGGRVAQAAFDTPQGRVAVFTPQGAVFSVIAPVAADG